MSLEELKQAKRNWEEQRAYYERELSITASPAQKFELRKRIEECKKKIKEIEAELKSLEKDRELSVAQPQTRIGVPFQANPLPSYYVDRPEVRQDLKVRLLQPRSADGFSAQTLMISAIHGLGAIGKSVLAAAIARDEEIRAHFSDGILWTTLGQNPDILSCLSAWVQAMGDYNFRGTTVESTSKHLNSLLSEKAVLLIVDDAWYASHVQPFLVGGRNCQILITSRDKLIATSIGANIYSLDVMTPTQSLELLSRRLRRDLLEAERPQALELAEEVGYLPLALEISAVQIAEGISWNQLLQDLRAEVAYLEALDLVGAEEEDDEVTSKRLSLRKSLNLSVQRLPKEKRQNFAWLGVLPEDVSITQAMTATLWDVPERAAFDTLRYLRDKAMLLDGLPLADGTHTYRMHDMFRDLACNLLTASSEQERLPGLGLTLQTAHATFLERYRQRSQHGLWHTLKDDGYIYAHLTWHMEKAGWVKEVHDLLSEETDEGHNGWYEACDRLGQTAAYLDDIVRAWNLAESQMDEVPFPRTIGLQCLYALITASLNSLAENIPAELLLAFIKNQVFTDEQGLAYARQIPKAEVRAKTLIELVPYIEKTLQGQALETAFQTVLGMRYKPAVRAELFIKLSDHLPEALSEAFKAALRIKDGAIRPQVLNNLVPRLPEEMLPKAFNLSLKVKDKWILKDTLSNLAPRLPEALPEAFQAALNIEDAYSRAQVLSDLAPRLPESLNRDILPEIRKAVLFIGDPQAHLTALDSHQSESLSTAPDLSTTSQYQLAALAEELNRAIEIEYDAARADALADLAPHLSGDLLTKALPAALAIRYEPSRMEALTALVPKLIQLPIDQLITIWKICMRELSHYTRSICLQNLEVLAPIVTTLGKESTDEVIGAIETVGRWWP